MKPSFFLYADDIFKGEFATRLQCQNYIRRLKLKATVKIKITFCGQEITFV